MYYYVYILQSIKFKETFYTGFTTKLKDRLTKHNNGEVPHTSKYKPWKIKTAIAFTDKDRALAFEKYLKSHSGRAFAKKHF
ncbi:MAG: GIY-YIG nuclease family protein [Ignavibacteriaceae bacterium]|nr:GIY-YIG nuclease family protein [Ignavibacteriaceae bacterium]